MDKKHKRTLIILRVSGIILLAVGLGLFIFGIVDFFSHFDTDSMPEHPWALFVAMPVLFIGMFLTAFGFKSKVDKFVAKDSQEVISDVTKNVTASAIKASQGIKVCPYCGHINEMGDKYCQQCGKHIDRKTCPNCGESVDNYSRYCPSCGHEMEE